MALIRFAEGQQRSGSMGASTYSHNRFGQYVRSRSTPVNPRSPAQVAIRAATLAAQAAWQRLTDLQRKDWEDYAAVVAWRNRFGDSVSLTGQQHFLRVATLARYVGKAAAWDAPPTQFRLPSPDETLALQDLVVGTAGGKVAYGTATDGWQSVTGAALLVFLGREVNPTRKYYGGPYRFVLRLDGSAALPPASPQAFGWPFGNFAKVGNLVYGYQRVFIPTIGLSEPAYFSGVVGAAP